VSSYLLDTDTCIYLIKRQPPQALAKLQTLEISTVGVSSITLSELEHGVAKSSKPQQNKLALVQFLAPLVVHPYDDLAAARYGQIRALFESHGTPIGPLDTLIAAHAAALGHILVTNNVREFSRVPHLDVENWLT
jgi:tRNA(fMet)-specific endonuclease VapC